MIKDTYPRVHIRKFVRWKVDEFIVANKQRIQQHLKDFTIRKLFIEELFWNVLREQTFFVTIDAQRYTLRPLVEKSGVKVYLCDPNAQGNIPADPILRKIERELTKSAYEHIIVYVDAAKEKQVWQWVKRQKGKASAVRYSRLQKGQLGELLAQKLANLVFQIEEEPATPEVAGRLSQAFDTERVTKKFYDRFQKELTTFLTFIEGITAQGDKEWYASLMLNRLMFIYFIQRQGFLNAKSDDELDGEPDYLRKRLELVQTQYGHDEFHTFYRYFLLNLFSDLNTQEGKRTRSPEFDTLLGKIPYLNGGLFDVHQLERENPDIRIPDIAFKRIFDFFDEFDWHLDDRELHNDKEINPDVLGYIFEKYINQKQMGAYYTKEDITEYISKNTIIPYLFEATKRDCEVAFEPGRSVWSLLCDNPDDYIYEAVAKGANLPLPAEIEAGLHDIAKLGEWNKPAPEEFALPTEIWREVVARRQRYEEVHTKLANGEVTSINDLITYNLDICKFAQDVITYCEGTDLLNAFYKHIQKVTVLDPTCGSGAFLFAALNILKPLYEACLIRMEIKVDEREQLNTLTDPKYRRTPPDIRTFQGVLQEVATHHNRTYFILKSIIINNLYGVDIMEEATEICKLRLFLKLVSQVGRVRDIEPLPDIDFNIRAGNTLNGFTSLEDVRATVNKDLSSMLFSTNILARIEWQAREIERDTQIFREMQTTKELEQQDTAVLKQTIRDNLKALNATLDTCLAVEYKIDRNNKQEQVYEKEFKKWQQSHQSFHWYAQFYSIMQEGGFDVIIGNPPYVEYKEVKEDYTIQGYQTESCGNLYAFMMERSIQLQKVNGHYGMIVPHSSFCTDRMEPLMKAFGSKYSKLWISTYCIRPAKLFVGVDQRLTIVIGKLDPKAFSSYSTKYHRWQEEARPTLFSTIDYGDVTDIRFPNSIPKIHSSVESSIWEKLSSLGHLKEVFTKQGSSIYFHNAPRYWIRAMTFIPFFWNERHGEQKSTQLKQLTFSEVLEAETIVY